MTSVNLPADIPGPDAPQPEEPKKLAGKFNSPEDLEKAYIELQKKLGQPKDAPQEQPQETPETTQETPEEVPQEVENALTKAGLQMDALTEEFNTNGTLSEDSYKALEAAGYPKAMVDTYLKGLQADVIQAQAMAEKDIAAVKAVAGGEQGFADLVAWAAKSLPKDDLDAYDSMVSTGNMQQAKVAVEWLMQKRAAAEGHEPRITHGTAPAPSVQPFRSRDEIVRAMSDKRYKEGDKAYHAEIDARLAASRRMGIIR